VEGTTGRVELDSVTTPSDRERPSLRWYLLEEM
jgi:hypothetical protein